MFAKENDLQLRDLLVFRHEGDMEFEVSIFDSSHCDREYAEYLQQETGCNNVDETCKNFEFKAITDLRHKTSDVATLISQTPASTFADANPHFISTIKRYAFTKANFYLPMGFVKSNGLMSRSEMILVDEKQRSWSVCLGQMERHFGIKSGWSQFRKANNVQEVHKIPIGFLKYLKGQDHIEHAILRRAGKTWLVKVNDWRLEEGWKKFVKENDLQLGDLLIFKHEGDMEFKVSIFDSSHCDRICRVCSTRNRMQ